MNNKWDQRKGSGAGTTNMLDTLKHVPGSKAAGIDESHFTINPELGLTVGQKFLMSDSKEISYDFGKYLDVSGFADAPLKLGGEVLVSETVPSAPVNLSWKKGQPKAPEVPLFGNGMIGSKVYQSVMKDAPAIDIPLPSASQKSVSGPRDKLVCFGGHNQQKKMEVEVYDPAKKAWTLVERAEDSRAQFGAISLTMNSILLFGGTLMNGNPTAQSVQFNLTTMSFAPHPFKLTQPKSMFGYVFMTPKLYIIGGSSNSTLSGVLADVEEYDMISGEIKSLSKLPVPRAGCACTFQGNAIFIVGGTNSAGQSLKSVTKYDTIKGTWEELPEMLIAREGTRAEIVQGSLFVFGGYDGEKFLCSIERYNAVEKMWNQMKFIPNGRFGHCSVVGNSGDKESIFVVGGYNSRQLAYVEEYDLVTHLQSEFRGLGAMTLLKTNGGSCRVLMFLATITS